MTRSNAVLQPRVDPPYVTHTESPQRKDKVLEAQGITISYQRANASNKTVLSEFSLQARAGEIIAVLGPSGIGKTSLLKILAGLQKPEQGKVSVHGQVLTGPHPRVSLVFQSPCLLPWKTLEANIGFGLDFKHQPAISLAEKNRRINDAIAETGLDSARGSYPAELSGGMAQRVALARSIARQPEVMLLDEPFSALDEITRSDMQELLLKITAHHRTAAILVTHDIDEALTLSDRIVLIGGAPARLMNEWAITLPHPRDDAMPDFATTRTAIVRAMRKARPAMPNTPTLDA